MTECALQKIYTYFSQFIWEKYVFILTSPNFFGRCQEKVGRSHMNLGEVLFFSMTESALKFLKHASPNFIGRSMLCFLLLPTFLGEVCFFFDFSQLFLEMSGKIWEKSYKVGRSHFFINDRKCTKFYFDILLPTLLGEACIGFRHLPKYLGDVCLYLGEVRIKFTCFSQTFLTSPNFFDIFQLQPVSPRSPSIFFFPRDNLSPCHIHLPTFLWFLVCF